MKERNYHLYIREMKENNYRLLFTFSIPIITFISICSTRHRAIFIISFVIIKIEGVGHKIVLDGNEDPCRKEND